MTRTYEIKPRGSNLGFDLKLYEDGVEMGGGIFPAHERITEAEAFDDAMNESGPETELPKWLPAT